MISRPQMGKEIMESPARKIKKVMSGLDSVEKKFDGGRIINRDGRAVRGLTRGVIR